MIKRISLLLPTRERPKRLLSFIASLEKNTALIDNIELVIYIDNDDLMTQQLDLQQPYIKKIIGPRGTMGFYNTTCYRQSSGDIIMLVNDDVLIRTQDWDQILRRKLEQYPDEIYLAYPDDLFFSDHCSTFPILSRKTCELISDPYPELYPKDVIDLHIMDIFWRLAYQGQNRMTYCKDIVFEHLHYLANKSDFDTTYSHRDSGKGYAVFVCLIKQRQLVAKKLLQAIQDGTSEIEIKPSTEYEVFSLRNWPWVGIRYFCGFFFDFGLSFKKRAELFYTLLSHFYSINVKPVFKKK